MKPLRTKIVLLVGFLCAAVSGWATMPLAFQMEDGNDTIIIDLPNKSQVIIVVENLAQLQSMGKVSIDSILMDIGKQLNTQTYPGDTVMDFYLDNKAELKSMEPEVIKYDVQEPVKDPGRTITLGLNWGGGLIRNMLSPALGAEVLAKFDRNEFGAGVHTQYFFQKNDEKWATHVNTFATVSYARDFSADPHKNDWHKLTVGYLIGENGNVFGENTFMLSYANAHTRIQPQLYVTDNFRSVFPGISLVF